MIGGGQGRMFFRVRENGISDALSGAPLKPLIPRPQALQFN